MEDRMTALTTRHLARLRMSAILLTCACLANSCTREDYGISGEGGLGSAATIQRIFTDKGLKLTSRHCDLREIDGPLRSHGGESDEEAPQGRCDTYTDDARAGDTQKARLYFDAQGQLLALRFDYRSDERDYDKGYYKIGRFLWDYWRKLGGTNAPFAAAPGDVQILGKEALEAQFETAAVRGRWIKQVFDGNLRDRVTDEVVIKLRLP